VSPKRGASGSPARLAVAIESGTKKVFASALDWPGWSRSGKTEEAAIESLLAYAPRYAPVARRAGLEFPAALEAEVVERSSGGAGTDFGVPGSAQKADSRPLMRADAEARASVVEAAWATFERVAAAAPAELRKGPRGGGRDRDKMVGHVVESDWYYAREVGLKLKQPKAEDRGSLESMHRDMLAVLREPSDGSPIEGRKWTARYAAHRIAWHALDHAWEMEDHSEPEIVEP
jgi:hypothetical protein